jgi:HEAT repeat protein
MSICRRNNPFLELGTFKGFTLLMPGLPVVAVLAAAAYTDLEARVRANAAYGVGVLKNPEIAPQLILMFDNSNEEDQVRIAAGTVIRNSANVRDYS